MKNILLLFGLLFSFFMLNAQERSLVWADEFNGTELNEKDWSFQLGDGCPALCGWGNKERQEQQDIQEEHNNLIFNISGVKKVAPINDKFLSTPIVSIKTL